MDITKIYGASCWKYKKTLRNDKQGVFLQFKCLFFWREEEHNYLVMHIYAICIDGYPVLGKGLQRE